MKEQHGAAAGRHINIMAERLKHMLSSVGKYHAVDSALGLPY